MCFAAIILLILFYHQPDSTIVLLSLEGRGPGPQDPPGLSGPPGPPSGPRADEEDQSVFILF